MRVGACVRFRGVICTRFFLTSTEKVPWFSVFTSLARARFRRATTMARSVDINAFQGSACIGKACFSPQNLTQRGDWRSMLGAWRTEPTAVRCRNELSPLCKRSPPALLEPCAPPARRAYLQPCRRRETRARTPGCSHSKGEEHLVMDLLGHMRNGTFVEIGGNDGLSTTNTYHLERCLGWQGVLIEGHPDSFKKMVRARPGALNLGTAVCREHGFANFSDRAGVASGINSEMDSFHRKHFHIQAHQASSHPMSMSRVSACVSFRPSGSVDIAPIPAQLNLRPTR